MASTSDFQTASVPSPSSSFSQRPLDYEVFLSFRGEDTRNTFTDHLYAALVDKGIPTFKDDEELEDGKPIKQELLDAIEKSRMAVIILSRNYASSTWCLEELAKIVDCRTQRGIKVLPIFYHVDPSDVRNQRGTFADAFAKHSELLKENSGKVQTWRDALKEVADLKGRHLKDEPESKFIKGIIKMVSRELSDTISSIEEDNLVGMNSLIREMCIHLDMASNDVRFIGICGMSGMGKTTLARVVFQKFRNQFRATSFVEDVSENSKKHGLVSLLENLLYDMQLMTNKEILRDEQKGIDLMKKRVGCKQVLMVLDNVDDRKQLESLAGNCDWFCPGSRIIVTTKDRHLLTTHGVQFVCMARGLNADDGLKLFSQEAFGKPHCEDQDFLDLCKDLVNYADGHPLALKVLGSSLLGKRRQIWESTRDKLRALPVPKIQQKLKICFDTLEDTEKKVFLDIACFFNGEDTDRVIDILKDFDCYPDIDIETLADKCLLTILGKKLSMHNLLQAMGQEIVRCENSKEPGKRSRLWLCQDIVKVLRKNSGTNQVEGIMQNWAPPKEEDLDAAAFSKMRTLRLLKISNVQLPKGLSYLTNELHLMEWHEYPLGSLPRSFRPDNLVELIMHRSNFEQVPEELRNLNKLKVMDLSYSQNLIMTPDFTGFPNLQRVIFQGCSRLYKADPSIGALDQLTILNLKDCKCLIGLPQVINLAFLEIFILSGCSRLEKFSDIGQKMTRLSELYLDGTAIKELPSSIKHLTGLTLLNLQGCKNLLAFPINICSLTSVRILILSGCNGQAPKSGLRFPLKRFFQGQLKHGPSKFFLPESFSSLSSLEGLDLSDCNLVDGALPDDLSCFSSLESLNLSRNNFTYLPDSISQLSKLKFLYLDNCGRLQLLPKLPPNTQFVMARECTSLKSGSNQVTVWTSGEAGIYTVINCLSLPDNEEDKVTEVSFLDTHFQPSWMEEQIRHSERYHSIPQTAIPEWFNYRLDSCIPIPLPPDLSKNSKWRGIVLYTTFEVDVSPGQDSNNFHELVWHLNMDGGLADCTINFNAPKDQCDAGSFGLCLYISRARFKDHLDGRNCITPSITTSSSIVRIQTCGGRILYEQDMVEFVKIVTQKNFGYSHLIMIAQSGGTILPVDVTDSLDFHPSNSYNYCFPPGKIEEWFSHHSCGNSAAINLPPNLYHDDSWRGIAVCTSFSIHGDPKTILNNLVPEISQVLFGQFRTNLGFFSHKCRQEIMWLMNLGKFIWISYIPGELIMRMINQRDTHIAASLVTQWPGMTVEKCALRLVYQHDLLQFEQKLEDCNDLISEYGDTAGKFMAGQEENSNDTELADEVAIGGTVHSNKELEVEMIVKLVRHQADNNRTDSERASWVRKRFDRYAIHDKCFCPSKILEWFSHRSEEPVATIPLPPNLNDNSTWMGLALSASFSVLELSTSILDSQVPYHLICSLETDLGSLERFHTYRPSEYERWKLRRGGCLWLSYIPRSSFPSFLNRCSYIEASIATDCTGLTAHTCGFRLLFENDEVEFDEAECHYSAADGKHELAEFMNSCAGHSTSSGGGSEDEAAPSDVVFLFFFFFSFLLPLDESDVVFGFFCYFSFVFFLIGELW